jgi:hypothetical protein
MKQLGLVSIIGATLVLAACGSAATASSSSPSGSPATGGAFRGGSAGQLVQINGQTLTLSGANGDITVSYTSATAITKTEDSAQARLLAPARVPGRTQSSSTTAAALQVGQCVRATGSPDASGAVQATALTITPAGPSGTCSTGFGGSGRGPAGNGAPAAGG